jgi:hypothetical protein
VTYWYIANPGESGGFQMEGVVVFIAHIGKASPSECFGQRWFYYGVKRLHGISACCGLEHMHDKYRAELLMQILVGTGPSTYHRPRRMLPVPRATFW